MDYVCDECGRAFRLDEDTTLNDLVEFRLLLIGGTCWHMTCARVCRTENDILYVKEPSKGRLIERGVAQK